MKKIAIAGLIFAAAFTALPAAAQQFSIPTAQTFSQLTLETAESQALGHSPDIAVANGKVQEQQALFNAAKATYGPALTANYAQVPQAGNNNQTVLQKLTTVGGQFTLGDLLAYAPAIAQANASLRAAQFELSNAQRMERINVIAFYYGALSARSTLQARRAALESAQADLRAAQLRFKAGDVPRLDVLRATVAVAQAEADLARTQADADNADEQLALETGVQAASLRTEAAPTSVALSPGVTPDEAIRIALAARPEIASAQESIRAEEHAVSVARRGGFPVTTLSAGYTTGVDTGIVVKGPSVGVNMTLPLGGASHERVVAEEARLAQAKAQLEKAQRQVTVEVGSAVRTYRAQTAAFQAAQRALAQAFAAFNATRIGYQSGASSSLDLQAARTTYVQALVSEISALYAQAQAQATLQLVVGRTNA